MSSAFLCPAAPGCASPRTEPGLRARALNSPQSPLLYLLGKNKWDFAVIYYLIHPVSGHFIQAWERGRTKCSDRSFFYLPGHSRGCPAGGVTQGNWLRGDVSLYPRTMWPSAPSLNPVAVGLQHRDLQGTKSCSCWRDGAESIRAADISPGE